MRTPVGGEPTHAVFGLTGMLPKLFSSGAISTWKASSAQKGSIEWRQSPSKSAMLRQSVITW